MKFPAVAGSTPFQLRTSLDAVGHEQQARLRAALEAKEVFGSDLPWDPCFVHALAAGLPELVPARRKAITAQANLQPHLGTGITHGTDVALVRSR